MKSLGNGWKRAQEARQKKTESDAKHAANMEWLNNYGARIAGQCNRPIPREFDAVVMEPPAPDPTPWQRIKRALVWGNI